MVMQPDANSTSPWEEGNGINKKGERGSEVCIYLYIIIINTQVSSFLIAGIKRYLKLKSVNRGLKG